MSNMDDKLDGLWAAYREAVPNPEVSPEFTPNLWKRIEARRRETVSVFRRVAQVCVMTTLALALLMGVMIPVLERDGDAGYYTDALVADQTNNPAAILAGEDVI